jgi:hypothetical protein
MSFYFCESCGKRVTAADLARGQGRDKQLKGVHCAACADGTQTVAFDAISQEEVWKAEQARRQGLRRSTSTRTPAARTGGAAPRRGRARLGALQSHKTNAGVAWAVLAVVLFGGVGAFIAIGSGSRTPDLIASDRSPGITQGEAEASPAQGPVPVPVAQAPEPTKADTQVPSSIPDGQTPAPANRDNPEPLPVPVAQAPEPTEADTQVPSSIPDGQTPEPTNRDNPEPLPVPVAQAQEPTKTVPVARPEPVNIAVDEVSPPTHVELSAEADSFVRGGRFAGRNFGTAPELATKEDGYKGGMYARRSYIRFDLSTLPASITSAKLRIYAKKVGATAGTRGVKLVADDTWQETAIAWRNAPAPTGSELATWKPIAGQFAELDLTAAVQKELAGDKKVSLRIYATSATGGNGDADFASREAGTADRRPVLIIRAE